MSVLTKYTTSHVQRQSNCHTTSSPDQWHNVEDVANPCDNASRAMTADSLLSCQRWLMGPEFLWKPEEDWPRNPSSLALGTFPEGDPKVIVVYKACQASVSESVDPLVEYFQRASSCHRLKESVARFLPYRGKLGKIE